MEKFINRLKNNKFVKCTAIRCARTFLFTILAIWTGGSLITQIDWKATLISAVSATVYTFLTCLVGGLPEVEE